MTLIRMITILCKIGLLSFTVMPAVVYAESKEHSESVNVKDFFSNTVYKELKISPTGEYYLISSDAGDRDRLVVIDRATNKPISSFEVGENKRISEVYWVTDERFIFQARTRVGLYDDREGTPNLYAANADGRLRKEIFTWDMDSSVQEVYKFDTKTQEVEQLTHDSSSDVNNVVFGLDGNIIGFEFVPDTFTREYIESSKATKLLQAISKAFDGQRVTITSATKNQKQAVIYIRSDVNPGEFYLFDTETLEAKFIAARLENLKSSQMANMQPIRFNARDGVELNGYLTMPKKKNDAPAPLIVKVHGGPHGVRDYWEFNTENQYFAANGFAVLQINFRGSGGYGKEFLESGYGEWGRKMQDDVTDATHWAIENGYADEEKICIYGASYGGYSSLMGVIKEPDLYQCAVGYVGVYSLPLMYEDSDIPESDSGVKYLREVIGENESELKANSPVYQADKIKVPVFLVHGSEDVRVPMSHFEQLTQAFEKHDINYKTLVREEGHGFQKEENKFELYPRLVQFFNKHLN